MDASQSEKTLLPKARSTSQRGHRGLRLLFNFILLLVVAAALLAAYGQVYHNGPPIEAFDNFFKTVKYEISDSERAPMTKDGFYLWTITNKNDFAWPWASIRYGETHGFPLEKVEPGAEVTFSNMMLYNLETEKLEPVPFLEGETLELTLYIDFNEEQTLPARIKRLMGMQMIRYRLGSWSR